MRDTNVQVDSNDKPKATQKKKTPAEQKKQPSSSSAQQKTAKETFSSYKKFAIGSYVHMLNEPVQAPSTRDKQSKRTSKQQQFQDVTESDNLSEEQLIDNYYEAIQKKAANKTSEQKQNGNSQEFDKLTNHVNSAANKKWKHSTQPAKQSNFSA